MLNTIYVLNKFEVDVHFYDKLHGALSNTLTCNQVSIVNADSYVTILQRQ